MSMSKEKVEAFWDAHDKNKDGVLTVDEVRGDLKSSGQCKMSENAVDTMFNDLGLKSGDNVTKEAFMEAFKKRRKEVLKEIFDRMDSDKSGKLNAGEVFDVIKDAELYSEDDLNALFTKTKDADNDQAVSCAEFIEAAF